MTLVKTLENGNKVYSVIENVEGVTTGLWVEMENGKEVRKWEPKFDELAGHSTASKKFGH